MKAFILALAGISALALPAAGGAQLIRERTDGFYRICTYAPPAAPITANTSVLAENRSAAGAMSGNPTANSVNERRVGLGQNCPTMPTPFNPGTPVPPTAQLVSERSGAGQESASVRICTYQQAGSQWNVPIEAARPCPLHAGMIVQPEGRSAPLLGAPRAAPEPRERLREE